jgi:TRAP-type C4-dicarboxylate transport system permease small subunit
LAHGRICATIAAMNGAAGDNDKDGGEAGVVRWVRRAMTVPRAIIGTLILLSIALNFANVIGRYVFFSPIIWAEEAMIFIMIWCVFIGAVPVSWDGRHLRMDLLSSTLGARWQRALNFCATAVFLIICGFIVVQSWGAVSLFARLGQESTVAGIPMVIPHSALLIGFACMLVGVAVRFRAHVTGALESQVDDLISDFTVDDPKNTDG